MPARPDTRDSEHQTNSTSALCAPNSVRMAALCRVAGAIARRACCSISAPTWAPIVASVAQPLCTWDAGEAYTFPLSYESFEPNEFVFLRVEGASYGTRAVELVQALQDADIPISLQDIAVAVQPRDWRVARYLIKVTPSYARAVRTLQRSHPYLMKLSVEQVSCATPRCSAGVTVHIFSLQPRHHTKTS